MKNSDECIVRCYGITKDPETNNFMMVMEYAQYGSLRQHLNNSFNSLNWYEKLYNLRIKMHCLGTWVNSQKRVNSSGFSLWQYIK